LRRRACGTAAGWGLGLCARDRAGLRPLCPLTHPAPSLVEKTLAAKLEVRRNITGEFLPQIIGPLAGNAMLAGDPSCGGTFAQKMRADAEQDNIGAQGPVRDAAPSLRNPLADAGKRAASQGIG